MYNAKISSIMAITWKCTYLAITLWVDSLCDAVDITQLQQQVQLPIMVNNYPRNYYCYFCMSGISTTTRAQQPVGHWK
jgi:hypothetical protein